MSDWPVLSAPGRMAAAWDTATATKYGESITASATVNTKGSWTQLVASLSFDADGVIIMANAQSSAASTARYLIDVGVGSAGNERTIIGDFPYVTVGSASLRRDVTCFYLPTYIKSGERLSARCQASVASAAVTVGVYILQSGWARPNLQKVVTYGETTSDSGGTSVDPGGTADTKGAWAQLDASTEQVRWLCVFMNNGANSADAASNSKVDIGVGSLGNERLLVPDLVASGNLNSDAKQGGLAFPLHIQNGQRLVARSACSIIDATDRLIRVNAIGAK